MEVIGLVIFSAFDLRGTDKINQQAAALICLKYNVLVIMLPFLVFVACNIQALHIWARVLSL